MLWGKPEKRQPTHAQRLFHGLVREWLWIGLLLLPITAYLSLSPGLALNNPLYDSLRRLTPLPVRPPHSAGDHRRPESRKSYGQWPWPRGLHADLIDRLSAAQPAAILFDVIFSEPADPSHDKRLADAVCNAGNVLLPLVREGRGATANQGRKLLPLLKCAKGLGHINVEADSDGVVRNLYLREGPVGAKVPQLAWLAYTMSTPEPGPMPGTSHGKITEQWHREHGIRIPFIATDSHFPSVSYASVLRGEVAPELLRDRLILVGATASGMGIVLSHPFPPLSAPRRVWRCRRMCSTACCRVAALFDLPGWLAALMASSLVALLLGLLLYRPRYALWMTLGCMATALITAWALLRLGHWWSPAACLIGLLLSYLIWNWRRLERDPRLLRLGIGPPGQRAQSAARTPPSACQQRRCVAGPYLRLGTSCKPNA